MICAPCRAAADARAPRDQHCSDPKCMCGHRTDRYHPRPARALPPEAGPDDQPCTATLPHPHGDTWHCALTAGHYDEADEPELGEHPGGWHITSSTDGTRGVWSDQAVDALPHTDTTED